MHYFRRSKSGQVPSFMATLTCLHSVGTNLTLTCPFPKSFACNLPDSGRHVTSVFQGLSLSRSVGRVGENPGKEVVIRKDKPFKNAVETESTRTLSNFNFQWTKTLCQNNLKHIAFFFTFFKGKDVISHLYNTKENF